RRPRSCQDGRQGRRYGQAPSQGCRGARQPPSPHRSGDGARCQRREGRGAGSAAGGRASRPQVERGGGPQTACPAVRGMGPKGPGHTRWSSPPLLDPVLVTTQSRAERLLTIAERYRSPADLPQPMPVFPLRRTILLPRAVLPLNVFEPRYLAMLDDVMSTARVLAIVQPADGEGESPPGKSIALRRVGCAGRVTAYQELDDGRLAISLTGIARCTLGSEAPTAKPYRLCHMHFERFLGDFLPDGEDEVDRQSLITAL